ncbi:MAG: HTH-type transcriptional regulator DmlR [Herbaspirillum frisingense]|uniref:HTH-type transcriptional regulator DmlR n=1 Tax=Herbaspirillum frisingense TaxID=92645 RepID=A0A7V8FT60_9BURK|nr:MAG: HTH-type transcriptional regulator DmlR [Herbaspirillum frisingense]
MKKSSASSGGNKILATDTAALADWEGLRTFAAFIDYGSFSGAARALGVTHATVSRRLQMLEQALQAPLFTRRADDTELTRLGETVLAAARAMQEQTRQLARTLAGDDLRLEGKLRIACTDALGALFLAPRLPSLLQRWPNLDVEFTMGHQTVSLARRDADLAIRFARPQDGELVARPLGKMRYYLCGTAGNLARWRDDRKSAPFVGYDDGVPDIPETLWHAAHAAGNPVRFRSTSLVAQCMAARAGVGMALLPRYLLAPELAPAEPEHQLERGLWAVFHRDLKAVPRLRAVLEWLEHCCEEL